jgi:hypothetical protein
MPSNNTKMAPRFFPQKNTKRPQTFQKDSKHENKGLIVIFGVFLYFFRGKTVGPFLYFLGGFLYLFRAIKVGEFLYFLGCFCF